MHPRATLHAHCEYFQQTHHPTSPIFGSVRPPECRLDRPTLEARSVRHVHHVRLTPASSLSFIECDSDAPSHDHAHTHTLACHTHAHSRTLTRPSTRRSSLPRFAHIRAHSHTFAHIRHRSVLTDTRPRPRSPMSPAAASLLHPSCSHRRRRTATGGKVGPTPEHARTHAHRATPDSGRWWNRLCHVRTRARSCGLSCVSVDPWRPPSHRYSFRAPRVPAH